MVQKVEEGNGSLPQSETGRRAGASPLSSDMNIHEASRTPPNLLTPLLLSPHSIINTTPPLFHPYSGISIRIPHLIKNSEKSETSIVRRSNIFDPFSFDLWDPFDGVFTNGGSSSRSLGEASAFAGARFDWKETPEVHVFKADLPGLKKEEVKVEVEDGRVLQISGERSKEEEEKTDKWHRVERSSGKFYRRFRLPENTKVEEVKAAIENGVLTVTVPVPKQEPKKPEVKSIGISSSG